MVASKLARFSWLPGGAAAVAVIVIARLIVPSSSFAPLVEYATYDRVLRASGATASKDIVIVDIDPASRAELGDWPWPRQVHARLLERLHDSRARVVGFTVPLGVAQGANETERVRAALALLEASNLGKSEQAGQLRALLNASASGLDPDARLADAIKAHGNVVLPVDLRLDGAATQGELPARLLVSADASATEAARGASLLRPLPAILGRAVSAIGHTQVVPDADGVVRSDLAAVRVGASLVPSLAVAIAARAASIKPAELVFDPSSSVRIGARTLPVDSQLRVRPHYFAPSSGGFTHFSYSQVLAGQIPTQQLAGKIVLVGFPDPETTFKTSAGGASSATLTTASTVSSLLKGPVYSRPASVVAVEWLIMIGVVLLAAFVLPVAGLGLGALAAALVMAILAITEVGLLSSTGIWMQLVPSCIATLMGFTVYLITELIRRANIKAGSAKDPTSGLRALGQTFQKQGQLDLAFETYRRCPLDAPTMELLYYLGMDFERRRQNQKAAEVYSYLATRDPNYRDLRTRRARVKDDPVKRDMSSEWPPERPRTRPAATPAPKREEWSGEWRSETGADQPAASGRKLGRYEIDRELGKGAMGVVYLGRDPNINRVVAIKAIPLADEFEEADLEEARARFFREAEMAGRLNHPAIVTVYDAGEDQGLAYIAMEYLRGQHLSHHTDSARLLPPRTVMTLVARTAEALHYAHRQNVVHRDIKPANIMFDPDTDELKITDFGIARLTDTSRTKTGIVLGTPSFMSPEQLEGRSLDGRSDQFALGVSLYQLLCGQLPFRAESMPRLMQKIATESHTPIRTVRPELPEAIQAIIDRVLAKSADDRYVTCAEFASDLRACVKSLEPAKAATEHEWLIP